MVVAVMVFAVVAAAAYVAVERYAKARARQEVDRLIAQLPSPVRASYGGLRYDLLPGELRLLAVTIDLAEGERATASELVLRRFERDAEQRVSFYVDVIGAAAGIPEVWRGWLRSAGYDELRFDLDVAGRYDGSTRRLVIDRFGLDLRDIATLAGSLTLTDLPGSSLTSALLDVGGALAAVRLAAFDVVYRDESLKERVFAAAVLRARAIAEAEQEARSARDAASQSVWTAYRDFLAAERGGLAISFQPPEPLRLDLLASYKHDPIKAAADLGMTVR